jgi:G3E family GTPase
MSRVPVHIITGFLGAGKTTFLNHFIRERSPERVFVIENECGAVNIDGALVINEVKEVVELTAGCLCCSLIDGLFDILYEAYKRKNEYDRLVIETTGIADPSSIVQAFLNHPAIEKAYELKQVICLVDALHIEQSLVEVEEALRQVSIADVLLVNKIDQVNEAYTRELEKNLTNINPYAPVFMGAKGNFSIQEILRTGTINPESVEKIDRVHPADHQHAENESDPHQITTFTLTFPYPLDLNSLKADLNKILYLHQHQVYRVKGFIALPHYPNRAILQSVRSAFIITDGTPWESTEKRQGKLVFIGKGLKKPAFEKMFNRHMVKPG